MTALRIIFPVVLVLPVATFAQRGPANLDFEDGSAGTVPPGWVVPTQGYSAELSAEGAFKGRHCVLLESMRPGDRAEFGNIMQRFPADAFRGKVVRLRAALRVEPEGPQDRAQMWLRVDREGRKMGFFDNMRDRPIRVGTWQHYEIEGDIDEDAEFINIGFMLIDTGRLWVDDVSFEVVADVPMIKIEPPRPLKGRALENLVAFTRLLGYVRYFHPSDQSAQTDWDAFAVDGVRAVESAKSPAALVGMLEDLFRPIAPTVRVHATAQKPPLPPELKPPTDAENLKLRAWRHYGVGTSTEHYYYYRSWRISEELTDGEIPEDVRDPAKPFTAELGGGVSCMVPLTVYADEDGTLPHAETPNGKEETTRRPRYTGDDRATRLADVALAWNVFQHFYPYFDVVETDWNAALRDALTAAATDKDERAFLDTLRRMVAALHDGHGNVYHASDRANATLPLLWDWVEDQLVVTAVDEEALGDAKLRPGDVVQKIDGRPAGDVLVEHERLISSATPQWRRHKALRAALIDEFDESVQLEIKDAHGEARSVTLKRIPPPDLEETRPEKVAELKPGIWYLDLERIQDGDFTGVLPQLAEARGIIFDMRGYPRSNDTRKILSHLSKTPMTCAQWHVPQAREPDRRSTNFHFSNWLVEPEAPQLTARIAFLTDGRAISAAETYMGIVEHYKLGEIVGGPTAGTNGNINPFALPGGYRFVWTGMKVLKHDGSQHHGVGILPTIPVSPTVAGIRAGKDEVLEKAIEVVSN